MFDLVAFLLLQVSINLLVNTFSGVYWKRTFKAWSYVFFVILMMAYPFIAMQRLDSGAAGEIKCGMYQFSLTVFLWAIGIPAVLVLQFLLNKFILKPTNTKL